MKFKNQSTLKLRLTSLLLSITLLASFAGVRAMENGQNNQIFNPSANLQHQQNGTLSSQACVIGLAINIINGNAPGINMDINNQEIDNNLQETFNEIFNNLIQESNIQLNDNFTAVGNYLSTLAFPYPIVDDNEYVDHLHQQENMINTNDALSQIAQMLNAISLNQDLLDAANAIIQAAQQVINNQNNAENQNEE